MVTDASDKTKKYYRKKIHFFLYYDFKGGI